MENAVQILITGQVQGVGFRYWTRQAASRMNLKGWVRNLADGRVEVLAVGSATEVDRLIDACRLGPRAAVVDNVSINDIPPPARIIGFEIQP